MKTLHLIGRIIVGVYYVYSGLNHFIMLSNMAAYAGSKGVPLPTLAVIVAGLLLIIAGLSIGFGYKPKIGILALTIFFIPVTLIMHNFWAITDPMARIVQLTNFTKNFALLGSALIFLAIPEPWPYSVEK